MNDMHRHRATLALAATLAATLAAPSARAATVVDLGTFGGTTSYADGINASGQVAGSAGVPGPYGDLQNAFVSTPGGLTNLGTLGGSTSLATAVNDSGTSTGSASTSAGASHAFVSTPTGLKDLGTLSGTTSSGQAINNAGQVAGYSDAAGGTQTHAFLSSATGLQDLGTLGGASSYAYGLNQAGTVVGFSNTANGDRHAFDFDSTGMHDLGTLAGGNYSVANDINDVGQIVGSAAGSNVLQVHAVIFTGGGLQDLGALDGDFRSFGNAINNSGQVVGRSDNDFGSTAFFYSAQTDMVDLNASVAGSGWHLDVATGINDLGQISGYGTLYGQTHAFRLDGFVVNPVPLPPSAWMALAGFAWLGLSARRRRPG